MRRKNPEVTEVEVSDLVQMMGANSADGEVHFAGTYEVHLKHSHLCFVADFVAGVAAIQLDYSHFTQYAQVAFFFV